MSFHDRIEAARLLSKALAGYRGKSPLIFAIPRGAVPMAALIAEQLGGDLDLILVRKLGAPGQPELAIGSVDESGQVRLNPYAQSIELPQDYLENEVLAQLQVLRERRRGFSGRPPFSPQGRIAMVVDDGIATGSTMLAALHAVRAQHPARLIAVTAVAPPEAVKKLREAADEVVVLETPQDFYAVGQFFENFSQVSDEEVIEILEGFKNDVAPA